MDCDELHRNLDNLKPALARVMSNSSLPQPFQGKLSPPCLAIKDTIQKETLSPQDLDVVLYNMEQVEALIVDYLSLGQY